MSFSVLANDGSSLNIRMFDYSNITVTLGDRHVNHARSEIIFGDLAPGRYTLKVIREPYNAWGRNHHREVVFHGFIDIPAGAQMMTMINRFHQFKVLHTNLTFGNRNDPFNDFVNGGHGANQGNAWSDHGGGQWWDNSCSFHHMRNREFQHLKHDIKHKWFDSSRKHAMKHALHNNHLSPRQIRELLLLFDHESSRLEMAKKGFRHTCDRANYFIVFDVFYFDSSVRALSNFMARHPH